MDQSKLENQSSDNPSNIRVLLLGYRKDAVEALQRRQIDFCLWTDRDLKCKAARVVRCAPFSGTQASVKQLAGNWANEGPFTHIIAATEAGVVAASIARRVLGAKKSKNSVILRCHDKLLMKEWLVERGIPMTRFENPKWGRDSAEIIDEFGVPLVVKDRVSSGGRNLAIVNSVEELEESRSGTMLIESFVDAPECSIESFIQDREIVFTNITEYRVKKHINVVPAAFSEREAAELLELNARVISALGLSWGMTHLEIYRHANGHLFGEVGLRPPGGYIMNAMTEAYGFNMWDAFVAIEIGAAFPSNVSKQQYAASVILHPGEGTIAEIKGYEEALKITGLKKLRVKAAVGEQLDKRVGVGQDVGHAIFVSDTSAKLDKALKEFHETFTIIMN